MAPFGIDIHIAVLGQFRTGILDAKKRAIDRSADSVRDYDNAVEAFQSRLEQTNGMQPGDPWQAVERLVDMVHRQNHFAGRQEIPLRIVLGSDAMEIVRNKCQAVLKDLGEQEALAKSTDFVNKETIPLYD